MGRVRSAVAVAGASMAVLLLAAPAPADPGAPVAYRPPVPGPVIDPYRPPLNPYGPGNRGIDYATTPGEAVAAPADGEVTFAGAVAGRLHVVILHADGVRTSLSFLAAVLVSRGQRVTAGQAVGRAGATLHFGARRGEAYLDPASLLAGGPGRERAWLVPDWASRPLGPQEEAAGLRRLALGRPAASPAARTASGPAGATRSGPPDGGIGLGRRAVALGAPPVGALVLVATVRRPGRLLRTSARARFS